MACVLLCLLLLAGCATLPPTAVSDPHEAPPLKLRPADLGTEGPLALAQRLLISSGDERERVDALLQIDDQALQLALLVAQRRVLLLRFDGRDLQVDRDPQLPDAIDGNRILRDLQFALWPAAVIEAALPAGWQLREDGDKRQLLHGEVAVLQVRHDGPLRWLGRIEIENLRQGYRLQIDSVVAP